MLNTMRHPVAMLLSATLVALPCGEAAAQSTRLAVDVQAGAGYSNNPFLVQGDNTSSGFTELSVSPELTFRDEVGDASLIGRYHRTDYFGGYAAAEAYGVEARARRQFSPTFTGHADVAYDSSIIGQSGLGYVGVVNPVPGVDLGTPDIAVIGLNQRQRSLVSVLGADWRASARDTFNADVRLSRIDYDQSVGALTSSRTKGGSVGYSRSLSERTSVGLQGSASWTDFGRPGFSGSTYSPQATLNHQFNDRIRFTLAAGAVFISSTTDQGTTKVTGLSGSFSGCRVAGRSTACVRASSDAQATGLGDISRRYGGSFDYSYRVRENDVVRGSIDYSRVTATSQTLQPPSVDFVSATLSYERSFSQRVFGGASVAYRQATGGGLDRPSDTTFRLFIRTRLGDRR